MVGETLFGSGYVAGALGPGADPGSGYGAAGPDSCGDVVGRGCGRSARRTSDLPGGLSNVSSLTIDVAGACLAPGTDYTITTDGPATIHFSDGRDLTFLLPGTHSGTL